jgi:hypothetical protein
MPEKVTNRAKHGGIVAFNKKTSRSPVFHEQMKENVMNDWLNKQPGVGVVTF